jgi:hypothetical protein
MCPWEHETRTDEETGRQFCVHTCLACGDTDSCQEPDHPHWDDKPYPGVTIL